MAGMASLEQLKKIYDAIKVDKKENPNGDPGVGEKDDAIIKDNKEVNVYGPAGVGKTWMTKKVCSRCTRDKSFDFTLWVFLCRDYNKDTFYKSIGRQLCLLPTTEEWEVVDEDDGIKVGGDVEKSETLIQKLKKTLADKKVLLVLDDSDVLVDETKRKDNEDKFWSEWEKMLSRENDDDYEVKLKTLHKIFISRSSMADKDIPTIKVEALPESESNSLLMKKLDVQIQKREYGGIQTLGKKLFDKSNRLPGTVTMIAKALSYFSVDASGVSKLEKELEEASEEYSVSKLLCRMHKVFPIGVLKDLWWDGDHFFRDSGSVHFNELITYWILEGYLGLGSMTELYEKAHRILMELIDCGILKQQDNSYVFLDKSLLNVEDFYEYRDQIASLGLASVFTPDSDGFGSITHDDGMLKTPRTGKKEEDRQNLSTLLLDGIHCSDDVLVKFLEPEKDLQLVALFNPTVKSLPKVFGEMDKLRVLVLRGCEYLEDVNPPLEKKDPSKEKENPSQEKKDPSPEKENPRLEKLCVLEISGGRSLKEIKPDFFNAMMNLQSLHLSQLQITSLPSSIYNLGELQWLVIKDCPLLKYVGSLSKLTNLLALDLSGNTALEFVDKNFLDIKKLQFLNISNTKVTTSPMVRNIETLKHLLLRDCRDLIRIRGMASLSNLQTLDLSGCTNFQEFHDPSLKNLTSLQTLDLSGTKVYRLPTNIANPRCLYLKNCPKLVELSCIESLVDLEVLDISGSTNLKDLEDDFFEHMTNLRVLNLSETKLSVIPSISKLSNLRELYVSGCEFLEKLPSLESATNLEVLDISHCSALEDIGNPSFEEMSRLQKLHLSETKIKYLPTLSNTSNLRELLMKKCTSLEKFELNASLLNLEVLNLSGVSSLSPNGAEVVKDMSKLQILDLSFTPLQQLPSMSNLNNVTHLSLAGCKGLETVPDLDGLTKLEVLDLSGSGVKRLPKFSSRNNIQKLLLKDCSIKEEDISDVDVNNLLKPTLQAPHSISVLSHLNYLEFPNIKDTEGVESSSHSERLSEEINEDQWNICRLSDDIHKSPLFLSGTQFLQIMKKSHWPEETFHLCAFPNKVESESGNKSIQRRELVFADVYLQTSQFSQYMGKQSLQIRDFNHFPKGIENIISQVDLVFLIDNKFKSLVSGSSPAVLHNKEAIWIERCNEMVSVFDEKERKDDAESIIFNVENLGISNNRKLESICNATFVSFNNLKTLYLDSCPQLSTVFSSSWLPKTLKVVQIKYCDKIKSLFEGEGELPHLETLQLWELPELERIGVSLPSLQTLKICECPKLKEIENFDFAKGLKSLWISGATSLKSLYSGDQESHNFINLEDLKLESCPMLENVISSNLPLEKIKSIKINSCEKLQTLFVNSSTIDYKLPSLNTLHLEDLLMLKSTGATFPSQAEKPRILECPNFDEVIGEQK